MTRIRKSYHSSVCEEWPTIPPVLESTKSINPLGVCVVKCVCVCVCVCVVCVCMLCVHVMCVVCVCVMCVVCVVSIPERKTGEFISPIPFMYPLPPPPFYKTMKYNPFNAHHLQVPILSTVNTLAEKLVACPLQYRASCWWHTTWRYTHVHTTQNRSNTTTCTSICSSIRNVA